MDSILARPIAHVDLIKGCCQALVELGLADHMSGLDKMLSILRDKELLPEVLAYKGKGGATLLHVLSASISQVIAADPKRETAAEVLIRYGEIAGVKVTDALDDQGKIPLQHALTNIEQSPRMIDALTKATDWDRVDTNGDTLLDCALLSSPRLQQVLIPNPTIN